MTPQDIHEITEYFKRDLPATITIDASTIIDCKKFVEAQLLRIDQGAPIIKQASYDHLVALKKALG